MQCVQQRCKNSFYTLAYKEKGSILPPKALLQAPVAT